MFGNMLDLDGWLIIQLFNKRAIISKRGSRMFVLLFLVIIIAFVILIVKNRNNKKAVLLISVLLVLFIIGAFILVQEVVQNFGP